MSTHVKGILGLLLMPALFGLALLTSGCNTVKGMGEDVSAAGVAVSSGAQKTEDKIKEDRLSSLARRAPPALPGDAGRRPSGRSRCAAAGRAARLSAR